MGRLRRPIGRFGVLILHDRNQPDGALGVMSRRYPSNVTEEFERPPVDPEGIVESWSKWTDGDELPGRTMADLKIAGLPVVLDLVSAQNEMAEALLVQWTSWEKAKSTPQDALNDMTETGLDAFIKAFAEAS